MQTRSHFSQSKKSVWRLSRTFRTVRGNLKLAFFFVLLITGFAACDLDPFETLGPSEHGVVFSALPPFFGGGVQRKVYAPKQKVLLMWWEKLYRLDTGLQTMSWGGPSEGDKKEEDSVQTRALDGNEVSLTMTVTYRIIPEMLPYIIQHVGITQDIIHNLVTVVARADIRTHMNYLRTEDFQIFESRQRRVEEVKKYMNERLEPEGVAVVDVIFEKGLFYREKADKTIDTSYQDQINETEQTNQKTEQERNRTKTIEEEMKQKFAEAEGAFFKVREQADGILRQAQERGDAKFEAITKDAERVYAVGVNEIEGMKKEVEALSGPGGKALLRKEIAQSLIDRDPKFVVVNQPEHSAVGVNRIDTNELVQQLGILSATEPGKKSTKAENPASPPAPQPPAGN